MIEFGIALNMPADDNQNDSVIFHEHIALGDMAESLSFSSIFTLEHHFTDYLISSDPFQVLAYFSGRTQKIKLGTAVIVLPWHDPILIAERIATLDILSNGRCLFAFGKGLALSEFAGLRIPLVEARARFFECAQIIHGALSSTSFSFNGQYYQIPEISIRPRAISNPQERFYGAAMSRESSTELASLGFGMLISTQKPWDQLGSDANYFRELTIASGHEEKRPIALAMISVDDSRQNARERALKYMDSDWTLIDDHYGFSKGDLIKVPGYESYSNSQRHFYKLKTDQDYRKNATLGQVKLQLVGSPDDCVQQIEELYHLTNMEHLILEFSYGKMPFQEAKKNMETFANKVATKFVK